jgi:hypothetical protein
MKKLIATLIISALSINAFAGTTESAPVITTDTLFTGSFGDARYSANSTEILWVANSATFSYVMGRQADGTQKLCVTYDAAHLALLRPLNGMSRIQVSHSNGVCTNIWVFADSTIVKPL